ncbi:EAL domain-containing protein [Deinococcus multiflagellatus]|uniref:EAL domain-containing protein n=1 Tax=Deinococcus multiflagellatus TaxID=1656887 RepID=UPI001CC9D090|nr:EAL domain-containing protein [Deinococcus multiflagellatus]MBZ9711718.1 EAL domain-containing protein [Deinococcus multiflagellatus]
MSLQTSSFRPGPAACLEVDRLNDEADAVLMLSMQRAQDLAAQALTLAERSGYEAGVARARMLIGYGHFYLANYAEACAAFQESAALAARLGLTAIEARNLNGLAITLVKTGQLGEALEYHLRCLQMVQGIGDRVGQGRTLNNIGNLYLDLRDYATALPYHLEALHLARQIDHPILISSASINAALDYHELGRFEEALALNEATLARAREAGYRQHEFLLLANMAANLLALGRLDEAMTHAEAATRGSDELGDRENLCDVLVTQGRVLARRGELDSARAVLERALALADELRLTLRQAEANLHLSGVLEAQGLYREALHHARRAATAEQALMADVLSRRTQVLATQLKVERLEHRAAQEQLRNQELSSANAALQQAQERLAYQAQHDALTGLLNRAAFESHLQEAVQGGQPLGVLFIDLDHFKQVNDTLGHAVGDQLLIQVAERLRRSVREGDLVARQGGDEFTVLLRRVRAHEEAESAAGRILAALSQPMVLAGRELTVTASIGVALSPEDGTDVTTLQKNADLAMYLAKRERHAVRRFQADLGAAALERLELEQALRVGIDRDELRLHYQPIVEAGSLRLVALEALVRWQHPALGLLPPGRFIPVAEASDLIVRLGEWVLREACRQLREWRAAWPELCLSVNVAPRQFAQPGFAAGVCALLAEYGLSQEALILEVTEGAVMDEAGTPHEAAMSGTGLNLALDDFGTGYSSISRLHRLPAQWLKMDRSLIQDQGETPGGRSSRPIVRALITFAHEAGLKVVAEGVETAEQLHELQAWGCDLIQGYLIARPTPPDALDLHALFHPAPPTR